MELRIPKWGARPEDEKPSWPGSTDASESGTEPANGQASQWWPEPTDGTDAGVNGGASSGSRWGVSPEGAAGQGGAPAETAGTAGLQSPPDQHSAEGQASADGPPSAQGHGGSPGQGRVISQGPVPSDGPVPTQGPVNGPGLVPGQKGAPGPYGPLARSGYSPGQHNGQGQLGWGTPSWTAGGRPPATNGSYQPGRPGQPGTGPNKPQSVLRRAWQRFATALAAAGAFLAKFGAILIKLKYIGLVLSMLVSIVAYSLFFGWSFAVGIVLLILVHEMGHVVELRRQGVPASAPLFIPFLGAFVNMRGAPRSAYQEALSGLAGPLIGTAASVVVAFWANAIGSNFLMALAFFGFFVNLFNLLPVLPLDGGRAAAALHPALWLVGLVALLVFEFLYPSPVIPIVLILGGIELWRRWRYRNSPASRAYNALRPQQRLAIGTFYLVLVAITIVGAHATYIARSL